MELNLLMVALSLYVMDNDFMSLLKVQKLSCL